jgi:hypothetical protein
MCANPIAKPTVTFDTITVRVEERGVRLSLEGIVPLALLPDPIEEFHLESNARALDRIAAEFPRLIPRLVVRRIEQSESHSLGGASGYRRSEC